MKKGLLLILFLWLVTWSFSMTMERMVGDVNVESTLMSAPNCQDINVSVNHDDTARFYVAELLSNASATQYPVNIRIVNQWDAIIWVGASMRRFDIIELAACDYLDETLKVHVSNSRGACWSNVRFKITREFTMQSNLDTVLWCGDPFADRDPNDFQDLEWYHTDVWPYTYLPTISIVCGDDNLFPRNVVPTSRVQVRDWYAEKFRKFSLHAQDWEQGYPCYLGQDTSKVILREWEAFDKDGNRHLVYDTITLIKLPAITEENIYAPAVDTIDCVIRRDTFRTYDYSYLYWKQLVGLHSDGTVLYYPKKEVDDIIASARQDSAMALLRDKDVLVRSHTLRYDVFDLSFLPVTRGPSGEDAYYIEVERGDKVLSIGGEYLTVTDDWFFTRGEGGFFVDIALPRILEQQTVEVCDEWDRSDCEKGLRIIIPDNPYSPNTCTLFCLEDDEITNNKCGIFVDYEDTDRRNVCPRMVKRKYTIHQRCFSRNVGSELPMNCKYELDTGGVIRYQDEDKQIVLELEQWLLYWDLEGPLVEDVLGTRTYYANSNECYADVTLPSVYAKDQCSGVKAVKASIENQGFVTLDKGADDIWRHSTSGRRFKLPCGGPYVVRYELSDNCHNIRRYNDTIWVEDNTPPTVALDNSVRVSLSGKTVWIGADAFNEGSSDNCEIRMMLARRTDWKTSCGVELCRDEISGLRTREQLDDYLERRGVLSVLELGEVERRYADAYEWVRDDGDWCEGLENIVVKGWEDDVYNYWAEHCVEKDGYGHTPFDVYEGYASIGGGWTEAVPFCCEDACQTVTVEFLVVDKSCNFSRGWLNVKVEDKSTVSEVRRFDDIYISCSAYQQYYRELIQEAIQAGNNSSEAPEEFASLDEVLGGIAKGWRGEGGVLVDADENPIDLSFEYKTTLCDYDVKRVPVLEEQHDGTYLRKWVYDTTLSRIDTTLEAKRGGIYLKCGATCDQDIWPNLNSCGVGTVDRRWKVYGGCVTHDAVPLEFQQRIHIVPDCPFSNKMFDFPRDTALCAELKYDSDGNVQVNAGEVDFLWENYGCRKWGVSYRDQVFDVSGRLDNTKKVLRTWIIDEWCSAERLTQVQEIILYDTCGHDDDQALIQGRLIYGPSRMGVENATVSFGMEDDSPASVTTDENGRFQIYVHKDEALSITPRKETLLLNGVDIFDLVAIQRHILGMRPLGTEEQLIAADVNRDGRINGIDMISIQQVTHGIIDHFPNNSSWRFFNQTTGEERYVIPRVSRDEQIDFRAVKIGDVDGRNVDPSRSRTHEVAHLELSVPDLPLEQGVEYIELALDDNLLGAQYVLRYDPSIIHVRDIVGLEEGVDWSRSDNDKIEFLYIQEKSNEPIRMVVEYVSELRVPLSELLTLDERVSIGVDSDNQERAIVILRQAHHEDNLFSFRLFQNHPNPTNDQTSIAFYLPEDQEVRLTLFDLSGRILREYSDTYPSGLNHIALSLRDIGIQGVLYYQLETAKYTDTKRMILCR